jgi:hypothetical protein
MDEYADIYYVDASRNAGGDHRTGGGFQSFFPAARPASPPAGAVPARTVYVQPASQPMQYAQPLVYAQPAPQSPLSSLFGNMHAGQVIALIAEALAAFRSLPAAPASTKDIATDIANGVTYDTALAQHAKTDEQIRTIGHLVAKLVR